MIYAQVRYRFTNPNTPSVPYGPEFVEATEIGTKNELLNRRLTINVDVFDQDFIGYQANVFTPLVSRGSSGIVNFGSARILGAELELDAVLSPFDRLGFNASFLHAHFGSNLQPVVNFDGTSTANVSGNELPNAPPEVLTGSYDHDFLLGRARLTFHIDGKYSSRFYFDLYNPPFNSSRSYAQGDAWLNVGLADNDHWSGQIFVRNFTNEVAISHAAVNAAASAETYEFLPPRTWGAQVTYRY